MLSIFVPLLSSHLPIPPINCCYLVTKLYPTLLPPDCNPPVSSAHGILQARILEWVATSFSRGSSRPRDQTCVSCLAYGFFTTKPPGKPSYHLYDKWNLKNDTNELIYVYTGISFLYKPPCLVKKQNSKK